LVKMLLQPRLPTVTSWSRTTTETSLNQTRISRHCNQFVERPQAQGELQIANEVVAASVKEAKDLDAVMTAKLAGARRPGVVGAFPERNVAIRTGVWPASCVFSPWQNPPHHFARLAGCQVTGNRRNNSCLRQIGRRGDPSIGFGITSKRSKRLSWPNASWPNKTAQSTWHCWRASWTPLRPPGY